MNHASTVSGLICLCGLVLSLWVYNPTVLLFSIAGVFFWLAILVNPDSGD